MPWQVILPLDEQAYSSSVIQRVVYSIARDFTAEVKRQWEQTTLQVSPNPNSASATAFSAEQVKNLVLQQLNDFALRERMQQETAGIRELLIRTALAGCSY